MEADFPVLTGRQACKEAVLSAAAHMCAAACTAPKARGMDSIAAAVLTGGELQRLAHRMEAIQQERPDATPVFARDAALVADSIAVVLIGSRRLCRGLVPCGLCGWKNCAQMQAAGGRCAYDNIDLGIAVGSAVSVAADLRIDNRVMYTAGIAAMELRLLGQDISAILAIPLNTAPRNPYFARK